MGPTPSFSGTTLNNHLSEKKWLKGAAPRSHTPVVVPSCPAMLRPSSISLPCQKQCQVLVLLLFIFISFVFFQIFQTTALHEPGITLSVLNASVPATYPTKLKPPVHERVVRAPFYLKLHKTGSTTISHHLYRFAKVHKLSVLNTPTNYYISTPNPTPRIFDAIVGHHIVFNYTVIKSYMKHHPDLVLSSIRLPLQRQVSWFQQRNKDLGNVSCTTRNESLLSYFDKWYPKRIASQYMLLQEASARAQLNGDVDKILDQFDFVFVKERMKESFECFCEKTGIRLCSKEMPMASKNIRSGSCVEKQLLKYASAPLLKGNEKDLLIYEAAGHRLGCRVSEWCRCPAA